MKARIYIRNLDEENLKFLLRALDTIRREYGINVYVEPIDWCFLEDYTSNYSIGYSLCEPQGFILDMQELDLDVLTSETELVSEILNYLRVNEKLNDNIITTYSLSPGDFSSAEYLLA